jgi:hypothetical protein
VPGGHWDARRSGLNHEFFIPSLLPAELQSWR